MKDDPSSAVQSENRRLAAIMFTDIAGFSRQMGSNEACTLRLLETHNQIIQKAVADHHGTVIKTIGDAFLVDFPSVVHAVQCAQQIHARLRTYNAEKEKADQIHVRIGIHLGDIVQKDGDVFGDGVNTAARLQTLAEPFEQGHLPAVAALGLQRQELEGLFEADLGALFHEVGYNYVGLILDRSKLPADLLVK